MLARQLTGIGGHDPILRQLTGSSLAPTRASARLSNWD